MDVYRLQYLIAIAEEGSVTKAAEKLFVTTSALSQYVTKEENRIGLPLFTRMREKWIPTLAGEEYIRASRKVLSIHSQLDRKFRDIRANYSDKLSVGFPPGRTRIFAEIYPKAEYLRETTQITLKELFWRDLRKMLEDGQLDLAFTMLDNPEKDLPESLEYEVIGKERFVLFVPRGRERNLIQKDQAVHTDRPRVDLKRLEGEQFITSERNSQVAKVVERLFQNAGVKPRIEFECATISAAAELASRGIGCAVVPEYFAGGSSEYATVCDILPAFEWSVIAVTRKGGRRTEAMETIIRLVREYFLEHAGGK